MWKVKSSIFRLFYFLTNEKIKRKKLSTVDGEDVLTICHCQNSFAMIRSGNCDVEDAPRSEWPVKDDEDTTKVLIDANRLITTRAMAEKVFHTFPILVSYVSLFGASRPLRMANGTTIKSFYHINHIPYTIYHINL